MRVPVVSGRRGLGIGFGSYKITIIATMTIVDSFTMITIVFVFTVLTE